jgi:2'-5' RNA ligase
VVEPTTSGNGNGAIAAPPMPFNDVQLRALSVLLDRQQFAKLAGLQFDGLRDLYAIFGYDRIITAGQYRDEYARGGIAKRIVEAYPKATWRGGVEVYEDEDPNVNTPFEKAFYALEQKHHIWNTLRSADILAGLSTYSCILIGAPGDLSTELPKNSKLLYLRAFFGGGGPGDQGRSQSTRTQAADSDVTIDSFDVDPTSERFGEPLAYRIRRTDISSPLLQKPVHWTRIIHVAEGAHDNSVYGVPTLEAVWNLLYDLEKVTGGGAESFFQRAKHSLNINIDKDISYGPTELAELRAKFEEYQHGITNMLPTRGAEVKLIESATANFTGPTDAILKQIAGTTGIPARILTGSEMGTLASEQDAANFNTQVQDRRTGYAGPMIARKLLDRLIEYGYLPTPTGTYEVDWPVEQSLDEDGKAKYALTLATVNKTQGVTVFTDDEIRDMAFDMEPLADSEKVPIGAPERISVASPPELGADGQPVPQVGQPVAAVPAKAKPPALKAAEEREERHLLRVLTAAIKRGDRETIDRVIGLAGYKYSSVQAELPPSVAAPLLAFGETIAEADLYAPEGGRETDPHVTVKYGLTVPDAAALGDVQAQLNGRLTALKKAGRLSMTMGKTSVFSTPDYDVVVVDIKSEDLAAVNRAIASKLQCAPSDHPSYVPHATVAYVQPGVGQKYAGWAGLDGTTVFLDTLVLSEPDGSRTEVALA